MNTKCPECGLTSDREGQPHHPQCSQPEPIPDPKRENDELIDLLKQVTKPSTGSDPRRCTCGSKDWSHPLIDDPYCPLHGRRGSARDHAEMMRAIIVTSRGITPHSAVQTAIDHALEAYDRYCEQEGLS
jgi:hypothetical protein